jgi:tetratricopeptide (TPR) repeat protein
MKSGLCFLILLASQLVLGPVFGLAETLDPPFWYPLTSFEEQAMAGVDEARRGDPEALLRLALMAAGIRDGRTFRVYREKITDFVAATKPALRGLTAPREQGRLLHEKMHHAFMLPGSRNGRPSGYSLDQSSLAVLVDHGRFNCTSSAILYIILARYFGLEVRGAIMPEHVFVELGTGKGGEVDIDTTSPSGFDLRHDQEFYRRQAATWATWRGLRPGTYRDYRNRRFISPAALMAMNMDDQHVRQGGMTEDDRLRLKEAQSAVMIDDQPMQMQRLGLYNNEFNRLNSLGDYQSLVRMFTVVRPVRREIARQWPADQGVAEMLSWLSFQEASALYHSGAGEASLVRMEESLELDQDNPKPGDQRVRNNNLGLLTEMVNDLLAGEAFAEALDLCDRFSRYFAEDSTLPALYRMIYGRWGNYHGQRQEWEEVIALLAEEIVLLAPAEFAEIALLRNRIATSYLNRAAEAFNRKDWPAALQRYGEGLDWATANTPDRAGDFRHYISASYQGRAIEAFSRQDWPAAAADFGRQLEWAPIPDLRQSALRNLGSVYNNWKNDYLRSEDLAGATAVLRDCAARFPEVDACREQLRQLTEVHRF